MSVIRYFKEKKCSKTHVRKLNDGEQRKYLVTNSRMEMRSRQELEVQETKCCLTLKNQVLSKSTRNMGTIFLRTQKQQQQQKKKPSNFHVYDNVSERNKSLGAIIPGSKDET